MPITKERYRLSPETFCVGGWWKGKKRKPFTQEHKNKISLNQVGRKLSEKTKNRISNSVKGENNGNWKGGISENKKIYILKRKVWKMNGGELTTQTIQIVYEDNIKQYGTLTCYLCLEPIEFGKDCLEHKIPLSRNGSNARGNLDIACQECNLSKKNKTVEEFKQYQQKGKM